MKPVGHAIKAPVIELKTSHRDTELTELRELIREYALALKVDLCFQNLEGELKQLPGDYDAPRGALISVWVNQQLAGCCALRPLDTSDYLLASEMKRLYVRGAYRGLGLGRQLAEAILEAARMAGYQHVLLDTLSDMEAARGLYGELGFVEIPPYYHNPIAGAHYLMTKL